MDWMLVAIFLWLRPVEIVQIPMQSEELCTKAIATMRQTLNAEVANEQYAYARTVLRHGVMASCVRVRAN